MDWSGAQDFRKQPLEPWYEVAQVTGRGMTEGPIAGHFRHWGNFTFATVDDSGHFVPHDRPAAALSMVNYWLHGSKPGRLES